MSDVRAFVDPVLGFAGAPIVLPRPERVTLADIVAMVPLRHEAMRPLLRVRLGGQLIDPALYHRVLPKIDARVDVVLPVQGGDGGLLGTLAVIALVGASVFVGAAGLPFLGSAFAAGSIGANLVAGGLSLAASLLLQGLNAPQAGDGGTRREIGVASAQNTFEPGAPLPRVAGTRKIAPPVVVPPFTRIDGDDQIVTVVYGLGGAHQIADPKIGTAALASEPGFSYEIREGFADDAALTLVTDTRIEVPVNLRLSRYRMTSGSGNSNTVDISISPFEPQWHRVETRIGPDRAKLFLAFEGGLVYGADDGPKPAITAIRLRMRKKGTSTWYNLPELLVRGERQSATLRLFLDFRWLSTEDMPGSVTAATANYGGWSWIYHTVENFAGTATYWAADSYFATNKVDWANKQQIRVYLDTATFGQDAAYEFEVRRGYTTDNVTIVGATLHSIVKNGLTSYDFFSTQLDGGVTRVPPAQTRAVDLLAVTAIQSIWNEYPLDVTGQPTALIAIEARNRSIEQFTCVASGYVADWDGEEWVPDQVSSNPASAYRHVLRDRHNAEPVADSLIDSGMLEAWHEWCEAQGHEVNAIVAGEPVDQVLARIAYAGFARPLYGATYSVVMDRPREVVGLITQRNAAGFSFEKPFGRLPHALRVTFPDRTRDYEPREITVYAEGYAATAGGGLEEATRFESASYPDIVDEAPATVRAARDLRWLRHRSMLLNSTMDIEHLEYRIGDLVLWETDILGQVGGRARVRDIVTAGGLVTGLVLDEERDFTAADADGAPRAVAMRLMDGTVRVEQVTGDDSDPAAVAFAYPFAMPTDGSGDLIVPGTLLATGALDREARPVLIWDIAPGPQLTARIVAIDYAEAAIYGVAEARAPITVLEVSIPAPLVAAGTAAALPSVSAAVAVSAPGVVAGGAVVALPAVPAVVAVPVPAATGGVAVLVPSIPLSVQIYGPEGVREPAEGELFEYESILDGYWWLVSELFGEVYLEVVWSGDQVASDYGLIPDVDATSWTDPLSGWTYHRGTYYPLYDAYAVYRTIVS